MTGRARRQQIINQASQTRAVEELGTAVYYLQKKVGLSRDEIFGSRQVVEETVSVPRSGLLGRLKDWVFGERTRVESRVVRDPGMPAQTFVSYIELMRQEAERKKKERKKQKMKRHM